MIYSCAELTAAANFNAFLSHMKIPAVPARATFGLSDHGQFEWSSTSLFSLFTPWRNIFSTERWGMVFDILRFNFTASRVLNPVYAHKNESMGDFLRRNRYGVAFQDRYLLPLVSSLWIHDPENAVNAIPMIMVVKYLQNHQLLSVTLFESSLQWLTISGGASRYVEAILEGIPHERIHTSSAVTAVQPQEKKLSLIISDGSMQHFDRILIATQATDGLQILKNFAQREVQEALKMFRTSDNVVFLHSDTSVRSQCQSLL
jgi:predicted NAD/FAD-binding protein